MHNSNLNQSCHIYLPKRETLSGWGVAFLSMGKSQTSHVRTHTNTAIYFRGWEDSRHKWSGSDRGVAPEDRQKIFCAARELFGYIFLTQPATKKGTTFHCLCVILFWTISTNCLFTGGHMQGAGWSCSSCLVSYMCSVMFASVIMSFSWLQANFLQVQSCRLQCCGSV